MHDSYRELIGSKCWWRALRLAFKMLNYSAGKSRKNAKTFLNTVLECSGLLHFVAISSSMSITWKFNGESSKNIFTAIKVVYINEGALAKILEMVNVRVLNR